MHSVTGAVVESDSIHSYDNPVNYQNQPSIPPAPKFHDTLNQHSANIPLSMQFHDRVDDNQNSIVSPSSHSYTPGGFILHKTTNTILLHLLDQNVLILSSTTTSNIHQCTHRICIPTTLLMKLPPLILTIPIFNLIHVLQNRNQPTISTNKLLVWSLNNY